MMAVLEEFVTKIFSKSRSSAKSERNKKVNKFLLELIFYLNIDQYQLNSFK